MTCRRWATRRRASAFESATCIGFAPSGGVPVSSRRWTGVVALARGVERAAGHRGDDRHVRLVLQRRGQPLQEADVLVVHKDVDEGVHGTLPVHEARTNPGELPFQVIHDFHQGRPRSMHDAGVLRQRAQRRRNPDSGHAVPPRQYAVPDGVRTISSWPRAVTSASMIRSSTRSKSRRPGLILIAGARAPSIASTVFSPVPVMYATMTSSGAKTPRTASARRTATVTPPAVSVKIPSVSARRM